MVNRILISCTENTGKLPDDLFNELSGVLPAVQRKHVFRFKRYQDRQASLLARLLVYHRLLQSETPENVFQSFFFNDSGRPCLLLPDADCSISHAKELVVCCIGYGCRTGIDIEKIKNIDNKGIVASLPVLETLVPGCTTSGTHFFTAWTMLESILKADGKGFSTDFSITPVAENCFYCGSSTWRIEKIPVRTGYTCHVAYSTTGNTELPVEIFSVELHELITTVRQLKNMGLRSAHPAIPVFSIR